MSLLPHKGALAIAAVVDVALHASHHAVPAKKVADHLRLTPRHLEPLLQALVRQGILEGVRGARGGYRVARAPDQITAEEILRTAGSIPDEDDAIAARSNIVSQVLNPSLAEAEAVFSTALAQINIEDLVRAAELERAAAADQA